MSYAYLFKYIIIGDTGKKYELKYPRCWKILLITLIYREKISIETRSHDRC